MASGYVSNSPNADLKFNVTPFAKSKFQSNFPADTVMAIAADESYYASSRAVIAQVRKHFNNRLRVILYDLGGIKEAHVSQFGLILHTNLIQHTREMCAIQISIPLCTHCGFVCHTLLLITFQKAELAAICNFEYRKFDFNSLPEDVRSVKFFSWKVLILAVSLRNLPLGCQPRNNIKNETNFTDYTEKLSLK